MNSQCPPCSLSLGRNWCHCSFFHLLGLLLTLYSGKVLGFVWPVMGPSAYVWEDRRRWSDAEDTETCRSGPRGQPTLLPVNVTSLRLSRMQGQGWCPIRIPQLKPGNGQSQGCPISPLGLPPSNSTSDCGSVVHKQSLNRNVTEDIIAISNDNTQF